MLFKTTSELAQYVNIDVNMKAAKWKPHVEAAEVDLIKPLLGKEQYEALHTAYQAATEGSPLTGELATLLPYVQKSLANYALFIGVEELGVMVGDLGIQQQANMNSQPAPAWKVKDLKQKYILAGDKAADNLLEFLEAAAVVPDGGAEADRIYKEWYDNKTANTSLSGCIVYKTSIANKYIDILDSRRLFLRLKKRIIDIERGVIKRIICQAQYDELVTQIKEDTLTEANTSLCEMLEPIISKRALYATMPMLPVVLTADGLFLISSNDSVIQKSQATITEKSAYMESLQNDPDIGFMADEGRLREFITAHSTDYPLILTSTCWAADVADTTERWRVDNDPCNKHFSI